MTAEEPLVLTMRDGAAGIIRLNRPKAMNALTLPMVRLMRAAFEGFLADPAVGLVLVEAVEGRAFCAGGDIRACAESGRAGDGIAAAFWREEYELIARFVRSEKPVVALMDGIVMGGGAGLAMHLRHRVVTEKVQFAMPEVGIGFLPDVGASYLLPRLPKGFGRYLALTGERIAAGDMMSAGLADHGVPSETLAQLRDDLIAVSAAPSEAEVTAVIAAHAVPLAPDLFARHGALIQESFGRETLTETMEVLAAVRPEDPGAAFAGETLAVIASRSLYSLVLTEALLDLGAQSRRLEDCLQREFRAACHSLISPDFHEGVRAAVIDKDRRPQWPSRQPGAVQPSLAEILSARSADPHFPDAG